MAQIVDAKDSRRDLETYAIIGAAMMVHRQLGRGFLELVYQEALEVELGTRGIPYGREVEIQIHYRGPPLPARYRADFICFGNVLVELKAASRLTGTDHSQIINYLVATEWAGDFPLTAHRSPLTAHRSQQSPLPIPRHGRGRAAGQVEFRLPPGDRGERGRAAGPRGGEELPCPVRGEQGGPTAEPGQRSGDTERAPGQPASQRHQPRPPGHRHGNRTPHP